MPQVESPSLSNFDMDDKNSVAVIGLASRLPGDATNPEKFWDLICNGRSTYSEVPKDRFRFDAFQSQGTKRANTVTPQGGHFLREDVAAFDANFFNISQTEATAIDPQQRIMLEIVYEAFENACLSLDSVAGTATGCFMGCSSSDYRETIFRDVDAMPTYCMSGSGYELISNRISFFYDLKGPSFTLGTACSSGMVAFHQGCQSIRVGESSMAVVGASNLLLNPEMFVGLSNQNFLSSSGCCRPFDSAGDGYGRAEGIAAIILKNLKDAIRDGDPIRAIVRGTGANQNGQNQTITRPNAKAQAHLIRSTYKLAGVDMKDVNYVEAHGTGTEVGDPTELEGIAMTLGSARDSNNPLFVGSVKSNIGHLEATAGFAGLIKAINILENGVIPPNINLNKPNPRIPFGEWNLRVPRQLESWPTKGPRILSVQAFGYGGTNAHAVLSDARSHLRSRNLEGNHFTQELGQSLELAGAQNGFKNLVNPGEQYSNQPRLFVLSAHDKDGLSRQSEALASHLHRKQHKDPKGMDHYLRDLAFTLAEKRSKLPWRLCHQASSVEKLAQALQDKLRSAAASRPTSKVPRIGFVFTGQGAQWPRMGVELLQYRVFRESITEANDYLCSQLGCSWSVTTELSREAPFSNINLPAYSQPLCAIIQIALVDLLESWGIRPSSLTGHSSGEIAGAYCLGALSKQDAWRVAYARGLLSSKMKFRFPMLKGRMMAVGLSREDAEDLINTHVPGEVVVACINSPSSITLSGNQSGIQTLQKILSKSETFARELTVDTAYHSPHMETISAEYFESIAAVVPRNGHHDIKMYSAVTGDFIEASELGPVIWIRNLVSPVLFYDALLKLLQPTISASGDAKVDILLEIGPHAALKGPATQTMKKHGIKPVDYFSVLRRGENAVGSALSAVSELYMRRVPVDLSAANNDMSSLFVPQGRPLVNLPPYSWNHSRKFWSESRIAKHHRLREQPQKSLIGAPCPSYGENERLWRKFLRLSEEPWVRDHKIQSSILYPAAGFLAMAMEGALQMKAPGRDVLGLKIRDFQIIAPAVINEDVTTELVLQIRPHHASTRDDGYSWLEFTISTCTDDHESLKKSCFGLLLLDYEAAAESGITIEKRNEAKSLEVLCNDAEISCQSDHNPTKFYDLLESIGFNYGPLFRNLSSIKSTSYRSCCEITIADLGFPKSLEGSGRPHVIHPTTLDTMFHCVFAAFNHDNGQLSETMVPQSIEEMYVSTSVPSDAGSRLKGASDANKHGFREMKGNITMLDTVTGEPCVIIRNFHCTAIPGGQGSLSGGESSNVGKLYSKETWQPALDLLLPSDIASLIGSGWSDEPFESGANVETPGFLTSLGRHGNLQIQNVPMEQLQECASWLEVQPLSGKLLQDYRGSLDETESGRFKRQIVKGIEAKSETLVGEATSGVLRSLSSYEIGWPLARVTLSQANIGDFLTSSGLLKDSGTQPSQPKKADGWIRILAQYVGLLAHKDPDLSILEIGDVISNQAVSLLLSADSDLQDSLQCAHYTFTTSDDHALEEIEAQFRQYKRPIHVAKLDLKGKFEEKSQDVKQYDLVILPDIASAFTDVVLVLANLRKLVKPGGKLCIVRNASPQEGLKTPPNSLSNQLLQPSIQQDTLLTYLKENSFTIDSNLSDFVPHRAGNPRLIIATASSNGPVNGVTPHPDVCLLEPSNPSEKAKQFASHLRDELEGKGLEVRKLTLSQDLDGIDKSHCISLLELEKSFWSDLDQKEFSSIRKLVLICPNLLWVTALDTPSAAMVFGTLRTIRNEVPGNEYRGIRLEANALESPEKYATLLSRLATTPTKDHEFIEEGGYIKTCRYSPDIPFVEKMSNLLHDGPEEIESIPLRDTRGPQKLAIRQPAMLDSLCLETAEDQLQVELADDELEMEVKSTGLNFRDVMVVMGQIPDSLLGFEASGIVRRFGRKVTAFKAGDKICALGHGAHRTLFRNKASFCQKMPEGLSFEEAATIPLVHCTAYHALFNIAKPRAGQTILIHAAAGGVGQAAIQLANHLSLEIFATVGSPEKRELIESLYGVQPDHIFSSRDLSFAKGVMRMTKGRGVDIILNSLSGEALQQSWQCIAAFGTFVEIGMKDILVNTGLEMRPFLQDASFNFFNLKHVMTDDPGLMTRILDGTFDNIRRGLVRPVSRVKVYPISEVENAFRLLQTGKHQGKIALKWEPDHVVPVIRSRHQELQLDSNATYLLIGGFGGIGRSLSNLLADAGAKSLCFLSRSGPTPQSAQTTIKSLEKRGITVRAYACDIGDKIQLSSILRDFSSSAPPIKGVFQCAMNLQDSLFERMSYEQWTRSLRPKVNGSWNLHNALPKDLDFFIMLSSFAAIFGNRSQSNYAAAGAFQDALAHHRRKLGLRAVAIDLGVMRDVGVLAEKGATDYLKEWEKPFGMREHELHALIRTVLISETGQKGGPGRLPAQIIHGFGNGDMVREAGIRTPFYFSDPRFSIMTREGPQNSTDANNTSSRSGAKSASLQEQLKQMTSLPDAVAAITSALVGRLATSSQVDKSDIDEAQPLHRYGVDSLVGIEVANWVFQQTRVKVSVFDIMASTSIAEFAHSLAEKSELVPKESTD